MQCYGNSNGDTKDKDGFEMKTIITATIAICWLASIQVLANVSSALIPITNTTIKSLNEYVQSTVVNEQVQGMSLAVLVNGELVHIKSFGVSDIVSELAVSNKTVFQVASITKLFVSTAVHELLLANNISVDSEIGDVLADIPENWQHIKISELLSHTSGLPDYYSRTPEPESIEAAFEVVRHLPFEYKAGTRSKYSQTGFALLHLLIEKLAGMPLQNYLQLHHFDRFKLVNTYYGILSDTTASGKIYQKTWLGVEPFNYYYPPAMYASAGINSSIEDLTTWIVMLVNGQILSTELLNQVWQGITLDNGQFADFSLGWQFSDYENITYVGHGGANISEVGHYIHKSTGESVTVVWLGNTLGYYPKDSVHKIASYFMQDIPQCSHFLFWQFDC